MKKVVSIGSALVDVFIRSPHFSIEAEPSYTFSYNSPTGKMDVDSFQVKTGGGGSNTAVGFSRLGLQAYIIAELGKDDLADLVISDLTRENVVQRHLIHEKKEETGGSVLLVDGNGERTALVHRGAASHLDPHDIPPALLYEVDWIHISSLSGRIDTLQTICKTVSTTERIISWNPGSRELAAIAAGEVTFKELPLQMLFVNKEEWQRVQQQQDDLLEHIPFVIVTDGSRGGTVYSHDHGVHTFDSKKEKVVDATGAGDAFATGFVAAFLHGKPLPDMIGLAIENASSVIQKLGAKPGLLRARKAGL